MQRTSGSGSTTKRVKPTPTILATVVLACAFFDFFQMDFTRSDALSSSPKLQSKQTSCCLPFDVQARDALFQANPILTFELD